ncbi:YXWGXW repeat-containing protein [Duganella sp. HSC-15S17]|uniref:YXWGXW repeat-containing protein n=3 Tax=Duganella violaceipulchra TaxID=2849652 RepID=A0AA41KZ18_9BURK|nr:YXWGXW repeat-containing protein [Duganella violaceicalia]
MKSPSTISPLVNSNFDPASERIWVPSSTSGHLKMTKKLFYAAAFAVALSGCTTVVRERVVVHEQSTDVRLAPAPIQEVIPPPPASGYAWVQGHWAWRDHGWRWQPGHWHQGYARPMPAVIIEQITVAPSPALYWIPGHWSWHHNEWEWSRGHWER